MFLLLRGHRNSINCISMPKTQTLRPICINTIDFKHCCSFINTLPIFLHIQSLKFNAKQISPKRFINISLHSLPTKFVVMQTHNKFHSSHVKNKYKISPSSIFLTKQSMATKENQPHTHNPFLGYLTRIHGATKQ